MVNSNRLKRHLLKLVLLLAFLERGTCLEDIPCPLVWTLAVKGDGLPTASISSDLSSSKHVILRVNVEGELIGGRLDENGLALVPHKNGVLNFTDFEILTNPDGCITTWQSGRTSSPFKVPFASDQLVGRVQDDKVFLPGQVNSNGIEFVNLEGKYESVSSSLKYEYLTSYSKGLRVEMTDFEMSGDPFTGSKDMLGTDEIHNGGNAEVRQVVTHRKRVFESILVSTSTFSSFVFSAEFKVEAKIELDLGGVGNSSSPVELSGNLGAGAAFRFGATYEDKDETESNHYSARETDVTVTREVIVPAYEAVQICSVISTQDDFKVQYTAKGRYWAPGLAASQVQAFLAKDGKVGVPEGNSVIVEESGQLEGTLYLMTEFIVVSIDPVTGTGGCSQLAAKIRDVKRAKALGRLDSKMKEQKNQEINEMINGFSKKPNWA